MGKLVVVQRDAVQGTDTHTVTWVGPAPVNPPGAGSANYKYVGSITAMLSNFVTIGGQPVALTSSQSSLKPGAAGGHVDALGTVLLRAARCHSFRFSQKWQNPR
jgi:hypothetical protein